MTDELAVADKYGSKVVPKKPTEIEILEEKRKKLEKELHDTRIEIGLKKGEIFKCVRCEKYCESALKSHRKLLICSRCWGLARKFATTIRGATVVDVSPSDEDSVNCINIKSTNGVFYILASFDKIRLFKEGTPDYESFEKEDEWL